MIGRNFDQIRNGDDEPTIKQVVRSDLESIPRHNHHAIPGDACFDVQQIDTLEEVVLEAAETGDLSVLYQWRDEFLEDRRSEDIKAVLELIVNDPQPSLAAKCLGLTVGIFVTEGKSESDIGKEEGVTRAAVCKRVMAFRDSLASRSRIMKSDEARISYRISKNGAGHWRRQDDRLTKRYGIKLTHTNQSGGDPNGNGHSTNGNGKRH